MDESPRGAPRMRSPYEAGNTSPTGRFGLLPSLLEEFFQPSGAAAPVKTFPLDIEETESSYQLTADLPGLAKENISIDLHENTLVISAERKDERAADGQLLWQERTGGKLARTIQLPQAVDPDIVKATYVNGVLRLTMQKLAATKTKKITIG